MKYHVKAEREFEAVDDMAARMALLKQREELMKQGFRVRVLRLQDNAPPHRIEFSDEEKKDD